MGDGGCDGLEWCGGLTACFDKWDSGTSSLRGNHWRGADGVCLAEGAALGLTVVLCLVEVWRGSWTEIVAAFGGDGERDEDCFCDAGAGREARFVGECGGGEDDSGGLDWE